MRRIVLICLVLSGCRDGLVEELEDIERQLTAEDEELTPTMKLKRSFVNKRYATEIDAMYRDRAVA